ncbi:MAG TPA: amidohydrolase family protein [Solirubrobacterales bacterium]|nr:amidohydrolase family protein [Solirubrobacterales bacterium]
MSRSEDFVLREAFLLDGGGGFSGPSDLEVRGGSIAAIGANLRSQLPSVEMAGTWLMPGVIDCHAHVTMRSLDLRRLLHQPLTRWVLEAADNCRRLLRSGVTFARDAAGAETGLRDAIAAGLCAGPELRVSILMLSTIGGHGDGYLRGPDLEASAGYLIPDYPGRGSPLIDGPDEMRRRVRELLRAGADWVKVCATGGIASDFDQPTTPEFSAEELRIAVGEARQRGRHVMAHAYGGEGLDRAISAGVRSIEHGSLLSEEQAAAMAAAGAWLVPTLDALGDDVAQAEAGELEPHIAAKALALREPLAGLLPLASGYGIPIALGSDALEDRRHRRPLREIQALGEAGLSSAQALLAATRVGAELCGVADRLGSLEPGKQADVLIFERDPSDLDVFAEEQPPAAVLKAGSPVDRSPRLAERSGWQTAMGEG